MYKEFINNPERIKKEYKDFEDMYIDVPNEHSLPESKKEEQEEEN